MAPKRKNRRLKALNHEATALLDFLLAEAYESGKEKHYRLKLPYSHKDKQQIQFVVEISVYFDGELVDESANGKTFRITGPATDKH
jgi:UDP-N-acetylglucosamine pyrophosphorylase